METSHILTWNVDWFRNGKRSGEQGEYLEEDSSAEVYTSIVSVVKKFLENDNAIVFLQEVPVKAKGEKWHNHFLYKQLYKDFPEKTYNIFINDEGFFTRCTIGISKKGVFEKADVGVLEDNRTIAVQKKGKTYIGTHMPTGFEKNDDNCKKWDTLLSFVKKNKSKLVICGDFNVYVGCEEKLTEEYYLKLLEYMDNYVDEHEFTYIGQTSIDKILLCKNEMETSVDNLEFQKNFELSDHKYVVVEIKDRE